MAICIESELIIKREKFDEAWKKLEEEYNAKAGVEDKEEEDVYVIGFIEVGINSKGPPWRKLLEAAEISGFSGSLPNSVEQQITFSPNDDRCYEEKNLRFWKLLAPFMEDGSFIIYQEDEGEIYRWRFSEKKLHVDEMIRYVWSSDPDAATHLALIQGKVDSIMLKFVLTNCRDYLEAAREGRLNTKGLDRTIETLQEMLK